MAETLTTCLFSDKDFELVWASVEYVWERGVLENEEEAL